MSVTAASDVQMELLSHTVRRLAKALVSALLVQKVGMFYSQTQSNIDQTDYIDGGRSIKFKSVCLHALDSEFRAADSQHSIRSREIVFDSF